MKLHRPEGSDISQSLRQMQRVTFPHYQMLDQRPTEVAMIPGNPQSRLSILQKPSVWKDGKYSLHDNVAHIVKIFSFLNDHLSKVGEVLYPIPFRGFCCWPGSFTVVIMFSAFSLGNSFRHPPVAKSVALLCDRFNHTTDDGKCGCLSYYWHLHIYRNSRQKGTHLLLE